MSPPDPNADDHAIGVTPDDAPALVATVELCYYRPDPPVVDGEGWPLVLEPVGAVADRRQRDRGVG